MWILVVDCGCCAGCISGATGCPRKNVTLLKEYNSLMGLSL